MMMIRGMFAPRRDTSDGQLGQQEMQDYQNQPKKPSTLKHIAGSIGDVLMQYGGLQPTYGPGRQRQAESEQAMRQAEAKRAMGWEDFVREQEYKRANPLPEGPTAQQQNFEHYQTLPAEQKAQFMQYLDAVTPKLITGADGRTYPARIPTAPVGQLRPVGQLSPVGGPTQPASGGFR